MWELNDNLNIQTINIQGTLAYVIDDFYKNPKKLANYLYSRELPLYKGEIRWAGKDISRNGKDFEDKRYSIHDNYTPAHKLLQELCGQDFLFGPHVSTNQHRFLDNPYNNRFKTHIWWPHCDSGYNGIVYFNEGDDINGTNLYSSTTTHPPRDNEHEDPWKPRENYQVIHKFKSKFNRCVFFDGFKFPHGMDINNNQYHCKEFRSAHYSTYRINQVFFFHQKL